MFLKIKCLLKKISKKCDFFGVFCGFVSKMYDSPCAEVNRKEKAAYGIPA